MKKTLISNGPNLNRRGEPQSNIYGDQTPEEIEKHCLSVALEGFTASHKRSIYEVQIVERVHDPLKTYEHPELDVHIGQFHKCESFSRHSSVVIVGLGLKSGRRIFSDPNDLCARWHRSDQIVRSNKQTERV